MSLTSDDQEWMKAQLDTIVRMIGGIDARIDSVEAKIDGMEATVAGVTAEVGGLKAKVDRLEGKVDRLEARFDAKLEKVETSLLTEFRKWAKPMELRVRSHAEAMHALDLEIENFKDQTRELEPPQTAH